MQIGKALAALLHARELEGYPFDPIEGGDLASRSVVQQMKYVPEQYPLIVRLFRLANFDHPIWENRFLNNRVDKLIGEL